MCPKKGKWRSYTLIAYITITTTYKNDCSTTNPTLITDSKSWVNTFAFSKRKSFKRLTTFPSFLSYFPRKIECLYNIKQVILTTFKTKGFFPLMKMNAFWKSSLRTRLSFHLLICKRAEEDFYFSSKLLERKLNKVERVSRWKKKMTKFIFQPFRHPTLRRRFLGRGRVPKMFEKCFGRVGSVLPPIRL